MVGYANCLLANRYFLGLAGVCTVSITDDPLWRLARYVSAIEVTMNMMAHHVVRRENTVAVPRGPKAVWLPMPPKVAAISALLPCCSKTTTINTMQTIT
jgi:hypothetical protein